MKRCLVVDDSRVIRKVARRILEDMRFEIEEAGDGLEALQACRRTMPDAILLDWTMPVMSGIEFLRQLRQEPNGDKPTVAFCTTEMMSSGSVRRSKRGRGIHDEAVRWRHLHSKFAEAGLI